MQSEDERITRLRTLVPRLIVLAWLPTSFFFGLVNRKVLPEKYFGDDAHIQDKIASEVVPTLSAPKLDRSAADSFEVMAWIYRTVGAQGHATIVQAVTMIVFFALLFACAGWTDIGRFSMYETGVFCFSAVACAVYLAQYSKEGLVLLLVAILVLLPRNSLFDIVFVAAVLHLRIRHPPVLVPGRRALHHHPTHAHHHPPRRRRADRCRRQPSRLRVLHQIRSWVRISTRGARASLRRE